jgi:hypothetical protein
MADESVSLVRAGEYNLEIKIIPGDNSCIFTALAHQLYRIDLNPSHLRYYSQLFRTIAANFIRANLNDEMLRENLSSTCREVYGQLNCNDQTIERYLDDIENDMTFWGGEECLYAFANVFRVIISVFLPDGAITTFQPRDQVPNRNVNLYYRRLNHYDSILSVRASSDSVPLNSCLSEAIVESSGELSVNEGISDQQSTSDLPTMQRPLQKPLTIGTWNIRGGARPEKRDEIDTILHGYGMDLICIQELRTTSRIIYTEHYKWYVNALNQRRGCRGTAILLRKSLIAYFRSFTSVTQNICILQLEFSTKLISIICFHSPSEGDYRVYNEYVKLGQIIQSVGSRQEIILMGDWNAHIGYSD